MKVSGHVLQSFMLHFFLFVQVLRELITRQPPTLEGPNRDPIAGEECPQEICDLISRCLSSDPGKKTSFCELLRQGNLDD